MTFYVGDSLKALLSIKLKSREDHLSDQVSRILVTKILVVASMGLTLIWFHSETRCIPPISSTATSNLPSQFIHRGCWAKGFYIYPHLTAHMEKSAYYGIPIDLQHNGYRQRGNSEELCQTQRRPSAMFNNHHAVDRSKGTTCTPMVKEYFTQYQWMPIYILLLSSLFYYPYIIFRMVNADMTSLRHNLKNLRMDTDQLVYNYFSQELNSIRRNRVRLVANYGVKCLYVLSNVLAMSFLHHMMNDRFYSYGADWFVWSQGNSTQKLDFDTRTEPTPGNKLLPTFGMCDLYDIRLDATTNYANKITVVCEMATHAIYQHTLFIIWLLMVFSNMAAIVGLLYHCINHLHIIYRVRTTTDSNLLFQRCMTIREMEYLDCIRDADLSMHNKIVKVLDDNLLSTDTSAKISFQPIQVIPM